MEGSALFDEQCAPELVPAEVQPAACAEAGWVLYRARRILKSAHADKLKGLYASGPSPVDVPIGAVVVDAETGEFIGARVRVTMGANLRALKKDVACSDAQPSKPCGATSCPDPRLCLSRWREAGWCVDARVGIKVHSPKSKAFWTLQGLLTILSPHCPFCLRICLCLNGDIFQLRYSGHFKSFASADGVLCYASNVGRLTIRVLVCSRRADRAKRFWFSVLVK